MSVHYRKAALIILSGHLAGRIGTERPHFIVKSRCIQHQLRLIQILVQILHDFVPHFHAHADIHRACLCLDTDFLALVLKPVRTFPAYRRNNLFRIISLPFVGNDTCRPAVFHENMFYHSIEKQRHSFLFQMLLQLGIYLISFLRPQMTDGAFDQFQVRIDCRFPYFPYFLLLICPVNILIRAEFQINGIGFTD